MSFPYLPFYVADYHSKTHYLSLAEHGAYLKLLLLCWETPGCSIPSEREWVQRRLACSDDEYETIIQTVLDDFFTDKKGRLSNCRLTDEFTKIKNKFEKRSTAGKKGGRPAKLLKNNGSVNSNALSKRKQNGLYPEPEPEPEPDILFANAHSVREPDRFEVFWKAYPKRSGPNSKQSALKSWTAALKKKHDQDDIINGVKRYARELEEADEIGTKFVCMAATYLNQERWADDQTNGSGYDPECGMSYWDWSQKEKANA